MDKEKELPKRKDTRLKDFDYGKTGVYFLTVCTQNRKNILSTIVGEGGPALTVNTVMGWLKFQATKEINQMRGLAGDKVFQRSFFDHIIRDRKDYEEHTKYIYENPLRWYYDELYTEG